MLEILLTEPSLPQQDDAIKFRAECLALDGTIQGGCDLHRFPTYADWLAQLRLFTNETTVPQGLVPSDTYFAVEKHAETIVGIINIRHRLNENLTARGGNIGYSIRPSWRGRGLAPMMLSLGLQKCTTLELEKVLLVCDQTNLPSAKTILRCGGVEEFTDLSVKEGIRRFWIKIEKNHIHLA